MELELESTLEPIYVVLGFILIALGAVGIPIINSYFDKKKKQKEKEDNVI